MLWKEQKIREFTKTRSRRVWDELLGIQEIGVHDNFFELGALNVDLTKIQRLNG
jgi:hypothetical protein